PRDVHRHPRSCVHEPLPLPVMSAELEKGFGTGLRLHLQRRQGSGEEPAPIELPEPEPEVESPLPAPEPAADAAAELAARRTELVAEEARLTELGAQVEGWATTLQSADREHADASAAVAKQLAMIAERERELKRAVAVVDERRTEAETRLAAREQAVREHE